MTPTNWGNAAIGTLSTLMVDVYKKLAEQVAKDVAESIREEREACAKLLDDMYAKGPEAGGPGWRQAWGGGVLDAAAAIRDRQNS